MENNKSIKITSMIGSLALLEIKLADGCSSFDLNG
jgi:hypothetical protein